MDFRALNTDFNQIAFGKEVPSLSHTFNVSYLIGAIVHHCKRLAVVYSGITSQFANYPMPEGNDPEKAISGHQPEPYFEFEALITATRRFYDSLRYILWQTFMPKR